jgi:hypothetical protein
LAGGERATYWLNGQGPLHHLLQNAEPGSALANATGAAAARYIDRILATQGQDGWLGPGIGVDYQHGHLHPVVTAEDRHTYERVSRGGELPEDDPLRALADGKTDISDTYWARYYLLMTLANEYEATTNETVRTTMLSAMMRHVRASAAKMAAEGFYGANGGWSVYRVHEYLLVLQWLIENAAASDVLFLVQHAKETVRSAWTADWERWFSGWENAHCVNDPATNTTTIARPWPACGMTSHGVNNAQAIKSAAVLWRFDPTNDTLKHYSNTRMASLDDRYGVATGLFCADESVCTVLGFEQNLLSRMPLDPTPARFKRASV